MIRLALVDCDDVATAYSINQTRLRNGTIVAIVDSDDERASETANSLGVQISTTSFAQLLEEYTDAFDAVVIGVGNSNQQQYALRAAEAGKHVLLDMPIASSPQQTDAVVIACSQTNVCLMAGQAMRYLPSVRVVKESVASGKLGDAGLCRMHWWEPSDMANANAATFSDSESGVSIPIPVMQQIDLAVWLFEHLPTTIYAIGRGPADSDSRTLEYVQLHLGFPDGGMAILDYSSTLPRGSDYFSLSVIGSIGAAYADDHHDMHLLLRGGEPSALKASQGTVHIVDQLQEFVDAIVEKREPSVTGEDSRSALLVAEAAAQSIAFRRAVQWEGARYEFS